MEVFKTSMLWHVPVVLDFPSLSRGPSCGYMTSRGTLLVNSEALSSVGCNERAYSYQFVNLFSVLLDPWVCRCLTS